MKSFKKKSDLLRHYVRSVLKEAESKKEQESAGIVILKQFGNTWKVLVLKDTKGRFDITKGLVEKGETHLEAALREASEEAGIFLKKEDFLWGFDSLSYGKGRAFVAATRQMPVILPNPVSKEFEHESWEWLSFKEAKNIVIDYLKPSIVWAEAKALSHLRTI